MKLYFRHDPQPDIAGIIDALEKNGFPVKRISDDCIEIEATMSEAEHKQLATVLKRHGIFLKDYRNIRVVEKVQEVLVKTFLHSRSYPKVKYSEFLSNKLHKDYTYLSRIFSDLVGVTIEQWIIREKINKAKQMLLKGYNVSEIAVELHYSSLGHLSNQFKKHTGISPSKFKQRNISKTGKY